MDAETLYTIDGGRLVALMPGHTIPRGLGTAIAANLGAFVRTPGLTIGSWDQTVHHDRPAVMSFTAGGTVVSVVIANMEGDTVSLADRIGAIRTWLAPMQLRDLSQLFTEPGAFYEGLWDMSPNSTITLQDLRRFVVITAEEDTSTTLALQEEFDNVRIELVQLDVFMSEGGDTPIIRWTPDPARPVGSATSSTIVTDAARGLHFRDVAAAMKKEEQTSSPSVEASDTDGASISTAAAPEATPASETAESGDSADSAEPAESDEPEMAGQESSTEPDIDLSVPVVDMAPPPIVDISDSARDNPPPPSGPAAGGPPVVSGRTYPIETLPYLFDPDDELLDSISDEMFAVPGHLVLVDKLPERRRQPSPFENPGRFRWDADVEQQTLLDNNMLDHQGERMVHLFVESDRQPGLATYVGRISTAADTSPGHNGPSMWFDLEPKVSAPLWQLFRKGRLPELGDSATAKLTTQS